MLTYVINTSENKTFDSDMLFDLAGYNKIKWMNRDLKDINICAEEIYEKQNVLGADEFRIAVLVDFYTFDRIRVPFGRNGYGEEEGVEISLYMPYIEAYLLDNLRNYLEKKDIYAADFEVYYVQNEKNEPYEFLDNAREQVGKILEGVTLNEEKADGTKTENKADEVTSAEDEKPGKNDEETDSEEKESEAVAEPEYDAFRLYCSPNLSLDIKLADYPYGSPEMTFSDFYDAFSRRMALRKRVRRHYYITNYGGGPARAAFDTLSLSLYLIRMYEREERGAEEGEFEVIHLDADELKNVLETAWSKVSVARNVAKSNNSKYFKLNQTGSLIADKVVHEELTEEQALLREKRGLPKDAYSKKRPTERYYELVNEIATRDPEEFAEQTRDEFDEIMRSYLAMRDATRENSVGAEFDELKRIGALEMTDQCPSREEYESLVKKKQLEISGLFESALKAELIEVDFTAEKKRADKAYEKHCKAKACLQRSLWVDLVFIVLTILTMIVPYVLFQLLDAHLFGAMLFGIEMTAFTFGFLIIAFLIQGIKYKILMVRAREELKECYYDCRAKQRLALSTIRRRYEQELITIEQVRYEIRQLKHLFEANDGMNKNIVKHREMLAKLDDRLSSMLNNLDVEPIVNPEETVEGEFDISKPIKARENKIYRIFSIETIERMFPRKGSGKQ